WDVSVFVAGGVQIARDRQAQAFVGVIDQAVGRLRGGMGVAPAAIGEISVGLVRSALGTAGAVCVLMSLLCGLAAGLLRLLAVGAALAYNAGLKSTVVDGCRRRLAVIRRAPAQRHARPRR